MRFSRWLRTVFALQLTAVLAVGGVVATRTTRHAWACLDYNVGDAQVRLDVQSGRRLSLRWGLAAQKDARAGISMSPKHKWGAAYILSGNANNFDLLLRRYTPFGQFYETLVQGDIAKYSPQALFWSPDERWLAHSWINSRGERRTAIIDLRGQPSQQVVMSDVVMWGWSPDSRYFVYSQLKENVLHFWEPARAEDHAIVMPAEPANFVGNMTLAWSPDSSRAAFLSLNRANGAISLHIATPGGLTHSEPIVSIANQFEFFWSPDSRWLAFRSFDGANQAKLHLLGERETRTVNNISPYSSVIVWQSDSRSFLYLKAEAEGQELLTHLVRFHVLEGYVEPIASNLLFEPHISKQNPHFIGYASYQLDGTKTIEVLDGASMMRWTIMESEAGGTTFAVLDDAALRLSASSFGTARGVAILWLVFLGTNASNFYLLNADGTHTTLPLPSEWSFNGYMAWSPDGEYAAFSDTGNYPRSVFYLLNHRGESLHTFTDGSWFNPLHWSRCETPPSTN
jgi:hypothetical protein